MAYSLNPNEPVTAGVKRIVREEIDSAIGHLRTRDQSKRDEGIHEARKSIKKIRGLLRLARPGPDDIARRENIVLRDAGRSLSAIRDAAAIIETFDSLESDLSSVRAGLTKRRRQAEEEMDTGAVARHAATTLGRIKKRLPGWRIEGEGFSALAPGLKNTYRKGRKALRIARKDPIPENFHEWRKRVKDHWYHMKLLEDFEGGAIKEREKDLKDLQEWLGDDHNLVVLREEAAAYGNEDEIKLLRELIDVRQREIRDKSLSLGERLYDDKPRDFVRRLQRKKAITETVAMKPSRSAA